MTLKFAGLWAMLLATSLVACGESGGAPGPSHAGLYFEPGTLNMAHRGGRHLRPENTLVAFAHAAELGVDVLEMDLHATADGVLVVCHDETVDRTTDGSGLIKEMTLAQLQQLDAGWHFSPRGEPGHPYRGTGVVVPTLASVLLAHPTLHYNIEIKQWEPPIVEPLVDLLARTGATERALISSADDRSLQALRALAPRQLTSLAAGELVELVFLSDDEEAEWTPPAPIVQFPADTGLDPATLARSRRLGLRVHVWTVNDREQMAAHIAAGVDGIISDDPVALAEEIAAAR